MDQSQLDQLYFIDKYVYNCPFCNRRNVNYHVIGKHSFDWTDDKQCFVYFTKCSSCGNTSMHLSFTGISISYIRPDLAIFNLEDVSIDDYFFYSVPTSFFVLDKSIPKVFRELITEAEGCLKSNFLTGASACTRKVVYELALKEKAEGGNYEDRIKSLKAKRPDVDSTYFDTLLAIQKVTSDKVHEQSYDGWQSKHLRVILSALREILREMYVVPMLKEQKRKEILKLQEEVLGDKKT
ncbi:MAG: hypothetical protein ABSB40_13010 [Nitrososphaeria archaeon]